MRTLFFILLCLLFTPTTEAKTCNIDCKIKELKSNGIEKDYAKEIAWTCKNLTKDPVHCIKMASAVITAESSGGLHCNGFNCFGINAGKKKFKSKQDAVEDWVTRYNNYWYKAKDATFFYGSNGKSPKSHYCMSEHSSNTHGWCPNGLKHAQSILDKLNKKF